jgi:hypothetical protein
MSNTDLLHEGKQMLKRGLLVFPLTLNYKTGADGTLKKLPSNLPPNWNKLRMPECEAMINNLKPVHNALAIVTGTLSDLIVVDVDLPAMNTWAVLLASHCLPPTVAVKSPSGGEHWYLFVCADGHVL